MRFVPGALGTKEPHPTAVEDDTRTPEKDSVEDALKRWAEDPTSMRQWLAASSREDLAELLQGLRTGKPQGPELAPGAKAMTAEIQTILRR